MYIILSYDVGQKRVGKVMKVCRKYLTHVQRSVFEGTLTEAEVKRLKRELDKLIDVEKDSVCIYRMESLKYTQKEQIGVIQHFSNII